MNNILKRLSTWFYEKSHGCVIDEMVYRIDIKESYFKDPNEYDTLEYLKGLAVKRIERDVRDFIVETEPKQYSRSFGGCMDMSIIVVRKK